MTPSLVVSRRFVFGFLLVYAAISLALLPSLHFNVFYGDLTRIGRLPESRFGWRTQQPAIDATSLQSSSLAQADVLVIGDSFSNQRRWQSVLVRLGRKVHTVSWGEVGDALCVDRVQWLLKQGLRQDSLIIAESVQRDLMVRVARSLDCLEHPIQPLRSGGNRPVSMPTTSPPIEWFNPNGDLFVGLSTIVNNVQLSACQDCVFRPWRASNAVRVAVVPQGCAFFSHPSCNQALFLQDDRLRLPLDLALVEEIAAVTRRIERVRVLWLVVPDKTSIYLEGDATFWSALERQQLGPDLFTPLRAARTVSQDLYPGNESHLSNEGFLMLGRLTEEFISRMRTDRPSR